MTRVEKRCLVCGGTADVALEVMYQDYRLCSGCMAKYGSIPKVLEAARAAQAAKEPEPIGENRDYCKAGTKAFYRPEFIKCPHCGGDHQIATWLLYDDNKGGSVPQVFPGQEGARFRFRCLYDGCGKVYDLPAYVYWKPTFYLRETEKTGGEE